MTEWQRHNPHYILIKTIIKALMDTKQNEQYEKVFAGCAN
jgi:hypothetical protein